jgi:hypothetical protein
MKLHATEHDCRVLRVITLDMSIDYIPYKNLG